MWSHDVVATSIGLASDLKLGQYLKIPPRVMFLTQVWGTILGKSSNESIGFPVCAEPFPNFRCCRQLR